MNIYARLRNVQQALTMQDSPMKVGLVSYIKPLLKKEDLILLIDDTVEHIGERHYIKATAQVINEDAQAIITRAYTDLDQHLTFNHAREEARLQALAGLFIPDTDNN